jgi:hypothetical protein
MIYHDFSSEPRTMILPELFGNSERLANSGFFLYLAHLGYVRGPW